MGKQMFNYQHLPSAFHSGGNSSELRKWSWTL